MALFTYTSTNFLVLDAAQLPAGVAGEDLIAGRGIYLNTADRLYYHGQCDGTAAQAAITAIAGHDAFANTPILPIKSGTVDYGAGASGAQGGLYVLANAAGQFWQESDLLSGHHAVYVGIRRAGTLFSIQLHPTGETRA